MALNVFAFDENQLFFTLIVTIAMQYIAFLIAFLSQVDLLTDITANVNFILNALLAYFWLGSRPFNSRAFAILAYLCISRGILGLFLLYRSIARKGDSRFDDIRKNFWKFFVFWTIQISWVYLVGLPVIFALTEPDLQQNWGLVADIFGFIIYAVGITIQLVADLEKIVFRTKSNKNIPYTFGLWSWSRHPNYFGEILIWIGIFVAVIPYLNASADKWPWVSILSPWYTIILILLISGIPTAEGQNLKRYYSDPSVQCIIDDYMHSTSPLIPVPPSLYAKFPELVKQICFFDVPMYQYSPTDDE